MSTLTDIWDAAALANASAVGIALDNDTDPHAAVIVWDGRVVWTGISPGLRRIPAEDLRTITDALTVTAAGRWAQARGGAGGFQLPAELHDQRRFAYATAGAIAMAATSPEAVLLDLSDVTASDPESVKAAVLERVRAVAVELDRLLRSKTSPPTGTSPAVLARRLISQGERVDSAGRYRPGPGWETLIRGIVADAVAAEQETGK